MSNEKLELSGMPVLFKNFGAGPTKYNAKGGETTFSVVIDDVAYAQELEADEWAVRPLKPREGETEVTAYHLPVKVNFDSPYPPRVYRMSEANIGRIVMTGETIHVLDSYKILFADVVVNKYRWQVGPNSGIKAYLELAYFIVEETDLDVKWDQVLDGSDSEIEANFLAIVEAKMAGR